MERTERQHLAGIALVMEDARAELIGPLAPPHTEHGWWLFLDLHTTRGVSMVGLLPITYQEIDAYQRLTRHRLTPLDVLLIREADAAFLEEMRLRQPTKVPTPPTEA
jgi:hypothetical protein